LTTDHVDALLSKGILHLDDIIEAGVEGLVSEDEEGGIDQSTAEQIVNEAHELLRQRESHSGEDEI
jgi:hypothetical protein